MCLLTTLSLSICLSLYVCLSLSVYLSVCLYLSICLSVCLSLSLCIFVSRSLSLVQAQLRNRMNRPSPPTTCPTISSKDPCLSTSWSTFNILNQLTTVWSVESGLTSSNPTTPNTDCSIHLHQCAFNTVSSPRAREPSLCCPHLV